MKITAVKLGLLAATMAATMILLDAPQALAQRYFTPQSTATLTVPAEIVALDECDPTTFNAAPPDGVGPEFCKNIALGYSTTLPDLFTEAEEGTPDPNWDFEPDTITIPYGKPLIIVNQGGEPHTFTEVKQFGGGFIQGLNAPGEDTVPECQGGFSKVSVAKTRILQGSQIEITGLSRGVHHFECCIHPWMRMTVIVK